MSYMKITLLIGSIALLSLLIGFGWFTFWWATFDPEEHHPPPRPPSQWTREETLAYRRKTIRKVTRQAWHFYARYGWGDDAVQPKAAFTNLLNRTFTSVPNGRLPGRTLLGAMSTLWLMNLREEFALSKKWVTEKTFDFRHSHSATSVYEVVHGFIGPLLSAYALEGDPVFLDKARQVADFLGPVYASQPPRRYFRSNNETNLDSDPPLSSEVLGQAPEYLYLAHLTGNSAYGERVAAFRDYYRRHAKPLRPLALDPKSGEFWLPGANQPEAGLFENHLYLSLLNSYRQSGGPSYNDTQLEWFHVAMTYAIEHQIGTWKPGASYFVSYVDAAKSGGKLDAGMSMYTCSIAGTVALGSRTFLDSIERTTEFSRLNQTLVRRRIQEVLSLGEAILETCHLAANSSRTGLPPGRWTTANGTLTFDEHELSYNLAPQLAHAYFILYRLTRDAKYQEYAWELADAILKNCATHDGAYLPVENVNQIPVQHLDHTMPAHFLASTLKYLWLIQSEALPLEKWIFNEAGQPLPIFTETPARTR